VFCPSDKDLAANNRFSHADVKVQIDTISYSTTLKMKGRTNGVKPQIPGKFGLPRYWAPG